MVEVDITLVDVIVVLVLFILACYAMHLAGLILILYPNRLRHTTRKRAKSSVFCSVWW